MNYLLDTCVVADFFKKHPSVIQQFKSLSPTQIHISSITFFEVEYGLKLNSVREKKIRPAWEKLLEVIDVTSFTPGDAIEAGRIRAELKKKGTLTDPYDLLLAGIAAKREWTFVTSNVKEFNRVEGIALENWHTLSN